MKLIILKSNLVEALDCVERGVGLSSNLPILKNVLVGVFENKITFRTTNLELAIETAVQGKTIQPGELTIPFSVFSTIIKNLNSDRVTLEYKNEKLKITTDNYEATLQSMNVKEFPIIPTINIQNTVIDIQTQPLKKALANAIISAQYSTIRPEISGVFFQHTNDKFVVVATDSFRLTEVVLGEKQFITKNKQFSFIIPLDTANEIVRMISKPTNDETTHIEFDESQILVTTQQTKIISRLIDGTFPEYKAIMPKEIKSNLLVNRSELLNSVKLVSSFSSSTFDLTLRTSTNKKALELYSQNPVLGENKCTIPAKLDGEPFSIIFNWKYLLDGVKMYQGNEIALGITPKRPAAITSKDENTTTYVLMPIDS